MNDALKRAHARNAEIRASGGSVERLTPIQKSAADPKSRAKAIAAKCWECVCGDADPSPRSRVRDCHITTCPLHKLRPWQQDDTEDENS